MNDQPVTKKIINTRINTDRSFSQTSATSTTMRRTDSELSQRDSIDASVPRSDSFPASTPEKHHRSASPVMMSPSSPTSNPKRRSDSYSSRKSNEDHRRYNNTVYHQGRHSNDWLFGGFSVRETVRDGVDWVRQHGKKS